MPLRLAEPIRPYHKDTERDTMGLTVLKLEVGNHANPEVTEDADSNHRIRRSEL